LRDNLSAINSIFDDVNTRTVANKAVAVLLTPADDAMVFIGGTDGGWFKGVTGAAPATYSDNGGSYCGTVFIPTEGDGSAGWLRVDGGYNVGLGYNPIWFGAVAGAADNTTPIMSTINTVGAAGGGRITISGGEFDCTTTKTANGLTWVLEINYDNIEIHIMAGSTLTIQLH